MNVGSQDSILRSIQTLFVAGSATGMTDRQLLEEFLGRRDGGAEAAITALVARHSPLVWSICHSISSDSHDAEDAFQATFLILVRRAGAIRRRETLAPWLHGVARRVAVRARKVARARRRYEIERGAEMKVTSKPDPTRQEDLEALHEEIDRLPEKYRAPVVLCHLQGRTHVEAAGLLKCPTGTVHIRLSRARELLRDRLTRRGLAFSTALAAKSLECESATAAMPPALANSTIKAAIQIAAGKAAAAGTVPAAAARLAQGVLRTMTMKKITIFAFPVLTAASLTWGVAMRAAGQRPGPVTSGAAPASAAQTPRAQQDEAVRRHVPGPSTT